MTLLLQLMLRVIFKTAHRSHGLISGKSVYKQNYEISTVLNREDDNLSRPRQPPNAIYAYRRIRGSGYPEWSSTVLSVRRVRCSCRCAVSIEATVRAGKGTRAEVWCNMAGRVVNIKSGIYLLTYWRGNGSFTTTAEYRFS